MNTINYIKLSELFKQTDSRLKNYILDEFQYDTDISFAEHVLVEAQVILGTFGHYQFSTNYDPAYEKFAEDVKAVQVRIKELPDGETTLVDLKT